MACAGVKRVLDDNNSDDESVCGNRSRSSSLSLDEYTDSDDTATNVDEDENRSVVEEYEKLLAELKEFIQELQQSILLRKPSRFKTN
ncbi:hypothetical protein ACLKA6_014766 [Drosophila palustris]